MANPQRKPQLPLWEIGTDLKCTVCGLHWPETEECRSPADCNLVRETPHERELRESPPQD